MYSGMTATEVSLTGPLPMVFEQEAGTRAGRQFTRTVERDGGLERVCVQRMCNEKQRGQPSGAGNNNNRSGNGGRFVILHAGGDFEINVPPRR